MKTLQEKKDCIKSKLSPYHIEFKKVIENLEGISNDDDFHTFFEELSALLALSHKQLFVEILLCLNDTQPDELRKIII
jgi:hypothetical protein